MRNYLFLGIFNKKSAFFSAIFAKFDKDRFRSCGKQILDRTIDGAAEVKVGFQNVSTVVGSIRNDCDTFYCKIYIATHILYMWPHLAALAFGICW